MIRSSVFLVFPFLFVSTAAAQTVFHGDAPGVALGKVFDVLGDINGDGVADLIAGTVSDNTQGLDSGRVQILSGADGSVLRTHFGQTAGDMFGSQVADAGDVDADGVPDYIVSAIGYGGQKGACYVFSGATGSQLHFMRGFAVDDRFGTSVSAAGDVDGDGRDDLLVGAPGVGTHSFAHVSIGEAYIVSGSTGLPLHTVVGSEIYNDAPELGGFVSRLGDVDGDGAPDALVATPQFNNGYWGGWVQVISGMTGNLIRDHHGFDDGHGFLEGFGQGVSNAGDVDGDGIEDYMYGVKTYYGAELIHVRSGATGLVLETLAIPTALTGDYFPPANVGDVDGDGFADVAYGTPLNAEVHIYSWATGSEIAVFPLPVAGSQFGTVVRGIPDVSGDGIRDIAIGVHEFDGPNGVGAGEILVVSAVDCPTPTNYCVATVNSSGNQAVMGFTGSTSVAANDFVLTSSGCPAGKPGLFFYGPTQVSTPYADGTLCVGTGSVGYFRVQPVAVTNGAGAASGWLDNTDGIHAAGPGQIAPGATWNFQFWFRDPQGGPVGFTFSDGLEVTFCP